MPVPWFLLSLALGRNPVVISLERTVGPQDTARCSPGLSCHLWDNDVLCLPGSIESAPGPVLVPTYLQTELVLRCHQETSCDLCVRVTVHLAVHILSGHREEPEDKKWGGTAEPELKEPGNASLQAQVVLSFQAYPTARCVLLEVQVPAARVRPGQSVGSLVFDCFEAALGAEVQIWSYTQPRYQKELNLTQQLPDCRGLQVRDSVQSCWVLPWLSVAADGDNVQLVLNVSRVQRFGLLLYWSQVQGPLKPWWHRNLTGPQTITLNHTDLVPCLCIQVWPLQPDPVRTSICPFKEDPRAHRNLWRAAHLRLLSPRSWRLDAPCSLPAEVTLCWQSPGGDPCQPLTPPLSPENVTVNTAIKFPVLKGHPNLCVQVRSWKKVQLHECLWSDTHKRWALVWLASLLLLAAAFLLLLLLRKDRGKGERRSIRSRFGGAGFQAARLFLPARPRLQKLASAPRPSSALLSPAATAGIRAALLLYSADDAAFERLVGALASALSRLPLGVAVDLWSRRELSAQGPVAWLHARRRQTLQERGVVVLLFSPGAVALCRQWLQGGPPVPGAHGPHDAFAASLSCVLPDFLQGRAPGRYVGACFDGLLAPDAVPAPFHAAPLFSLPSQLRGFLGALQGPHAARFGRLEDSAEQVARALRPVLDSCFQPPRLGMGPEAGAGLE
nr:interleukin-17 receptor C isoform X5 [Cavia porcellus]